MLTLALEIVTRRSSSGWRITSSTGTTAYPEPAKPVFPQSDPALSNAPITNPNSIIPPDATDRPVR